MANYSAQSLGVASMPSVTMNSAASGGDAFTNDGRTIVLFSNSSGAAITVTFVTPATAQGVAIADPTAVIADGAVRQPVGVFPEALFNDANGRVAMTFSSHTGLSFGVVRIP